MLQQEIMMSDQTQMPLHPADELRRPRRGLRLPGIVALVLAAGVTVVLATTAFSRGMGPMGFGPGGWHGGFMGRGFDPAAIEERADRAVRHLSVELDATYD